MLEATDAILFVKMKGDLTVGERRKAMSVLLQFCPNAFKIVEFAVDDQAERIVLVGHRLATGRGVDEAQASVP